MLMEKDHRNLDELHYFPSNRIYSYLLKSRKLLKIKKSKRKVHVERKYVSKLIKIIFLVT